MLQRWPAIALCCNYVTNSSLLSYFRKDPSKEGQRECEAKHPLKDGPINAVDHVDDINGPHLLRTKVKKHQHTTNQPHVMLTCKIVNIVFIHHCPLVHHVKKTQKQTGKTYVTHLSNPYHQSSKTGSIELVCKHH